MTWWANLLRRARMRGLREALVQVIRVEALEDDAKDDAERWQDYGFAGNPGDGQGLVINAGGHTVVLRLDRIADRPQLAEFEVAVWHKEGHKITLKAGSVIEVDCTRLVCTGSIEAPSIKVDGKELADHRHGGVSSGGSLSGPNT